MCVCVCSSVHPERMAMAKQFRQLYIQILRKGIKVGEAEIQRLAQLYDFDINAEQEAQSDMARNPEMRDASALAVLHPIDRDDRIEVRDNVTHPEL